MNINRGEKISAVMNVKISGYADVSLKDQIQNYNIGGVTGESLWLDHEKRSLVIDKFFKDVYDNTDLETIDATRLGKSEKENVTKQLTEEMASYYKAFTRSLFGVLVRTPTPGTESAAYYEIKEFISDASNTLRLPPELCAIDNSDNDGDTRAVYGYRIDVVESESGKVSYEVVVDDEYVKGNTETSDVNDFSNYSNTTLAIYEDYYKDINNADSYTNILSTDRINSVTNKAKARKSKDGVISNTSTKLFDDFTTVLPNHTGAHLSAKMIGIMANSLTTASRIMKAVALNPSLKSEIQLSLEFLLEGETSTTNIAETLQAALDGVKKDILSEFNLNTSNNNMFIAMLLDGNTMEQVIDKFANNGLLNGAFRNMSRSKSLGEFGSITFKEALGTSFDNRVRVKRAELTKGRTDNAAIEEEIAIYKDDLQTEVDWYLDY
jgi:hypothetical protein